jgi:hypothetical protein
LYRSIDVGDNWNVESVNPLYLSVTAAALGGIALHAAVACDEGVGDSYVYVGTYTPPIPTSTPVYPVVDKLGIEGFYAALQVDEVEIIKLPVESDYLDIDVE